MATPAQTAFNATHKDGPGDQGSTYVRASFTTPSTPGSYLLVIVVTAGGLGITHSLSGGAFTKLRDIAVRDLQVSIWGQAGAPATSSVTASVPAYRGMTVRMLEYQGVAQASAVDRSVGSSGESATASTGSSGTTSRADETVVAVMANQYATTTQSGFSGGLAKLFEDLTPDDGTQDWERSRTTVHQLVTSATGSFSLSASLSTARRWVAALITLKGGTTGPAKLYSTSQPPLYLVGGNRGSSLTVFGRLASATQPPLYVAGIGVRARIGPAAYQMRLGGWSGLLVGAGTDFLIESVDGLEGWEVRTSDDDLPRGDGALRGVDLQTARQILIKLNWAGTRTQIEARAAALLRALVPQRDLDWELIYRLPGQPLKSVYCRPTNLIRGLDPLQVLLHQQVITLRAADPRHYSAAVTKLSVPISASRDSPVLVTAINDGSGMASPVIRINGAGAPASRMVLTNLTTGGRFDVAAALGAGSSLVGDMQARVTGAPVSAVTVDGASKYGAWQPPRVPFTLAPGINELMFEVQPAGAAPACVIEWRSTWSG